MSIAIGKKSPSFELLDQTGHTQRLSDVDSDYTVIYFYPKDDTPGCTLEGQQFTKLLKAFSASKTRIFGISGLDYKSKSKFCVKQKIGVTLLADSDFSISKAFLSYGQKQFMGRSYMGIIRNTFVLDRNKKIIRIYENVKPEGHAAEVLNFIREQQSSASSRKNGAKAGSKIKMKKSTKPEKIDPKPISSKRSLKASKLGKKTGRNK